MGKIGDLRLESGQVIKDCQVEYRIVGAANADKSNVVVWGTWFSGITKENAIDGLNDNNFNAMWRVSRALPQSITLDLGQSRPDVGIVSVTPRYANNRGVTDGNITSYRILAGINDSTLAEVAAGTWPADAKLQVITFPPTAARYVRVEVRAANGTAAATEIGVGGR